VRAEIVAIGTSLGGLRALEIILAGLDKRFSVPIALVMHRGTSARDSLVSILKQRTALTVREPEDKEILTPGSVYVAPADYHLLVERGHCALSLDPPVNFARPSVDVLFESAANGFGMGTVAIVLTGNNNDGAGGAARVKAAGGVVVVQDPDECESGNMPRSTMAAVQVDAVLKLSEMSSFLIDLCGIIEEKQNGT
jgi:two-component system chemotaxis response regulator CheB